MPRKAIVLPGKVKAKTWFDEQDAVLAKQAIAAVQPRPVRSRKQLISFLEPDLITAFVQGAMLCQLQTALREHSIPMATSALVKLQRQARKFMAPEVPPRATQPVTSPVGKTDHTGDAFSGLASRRRGS
jgi:hypothetical protein